MNFDQKNIFPAHINDFGTIQSVREHCLGTAEISEKILFTVNMSGMGSLVGILHDTGKYTSAFREYITKSYHGEKVS